jgi:hypothetical protein
VLFAGDIIGDYCIRAAEKNLMWCRCLNRILGCIATGQGIIRIFKR